MLTVLENDGRAWSPRRRGCSDSVTAWRSRTIVVPAQAGVFRLRARRMQALSRGPRAGGGVPPRGRYPERPVPWSPRRRGCSASPRDAPERAGVVPAQAGVFRRRRRGSRGRHRGPRAGGGVPTAGAIIGSRLSWSPRRRGCSDIGDVGRLGCDLVPAQAGVFRCGRRPGGCGGSGPRAGGGALRMGVGSDDRFTPPRRGKHSAPQPVAAIHAGSSPPSPAVEARGRGLAKVAVCRLTPACAGSTGSRTSETRSGTAHPRPRGKHTS